ncbi:hypothetical protein [Paenibacillus humicola]|uniref:hypothetical protein n=1 Tax=Paenibacillus humicola TaxID=3110540 RepID=UPI00237B0877|nr:hypothetical protein [Paenibacillus humicola]
MSKQTEVQTNGPGPDQPRQPSSGQAGRKSSPIEEARNGHMVQDEQDMRRLGNDMKGMKTNSQLQEGGWIPDPIQE